MKVKEIIPLNCSDCSTPWHPELVVQGDDKHFYLVGTCRTCNERVAANIQILYASLYAANYGVH